MTDDDLKKKMLSALNDAPPVVVPQPETPPVAAKPEGKDFDNEYNYANEKLKGLVEYGEDALEYFSTIAQETKEPRAFEVLATLLKNTGELVRGVMENAATKSTIEAHKSKRVVGDGDGKVTNNTTITFVGTPKELLDKINTEQKTIDGNATEV